MKCLIRPTLQIPPRTSRLLSCSQTTTPGNRQISLAEAAVAVLIPSAARVITAGENAAEFCALVEAVTEFWNPQDVFDGSHV